MLAMGSSNACAVEMSYSSWRGKHDADHYEPGVRIGFPVLGLTHSREDLPAKVGDNAAQAKIPPYQPRRIKEALEPADVIDLEEARQRLF